ncbi:MAG: gephyrin-like molybdotransferase Glp [Pseudomonadota bacterium]
MSIAPPLRNDCFALPPGVDWVPMETALDRLRARLTPVTATETRPLGPDLAGRILAGDVAALRANPPADNSAVDGYAFAGPVPDGLVSLPLAAGRSAAGQPLEGAVAPGHAVRILTGAILPPGVDTVVLQEDVAIDGDTISFHGPLKAGANARKAGEDVTVGQTLLAEGRRLTPADIALLASGGIAEVSVRQRLRVGVLSNGDEVIAPGDVPPERMGRGKIYDANRPMLLAQLAAWGYSPVDLGAAPDTRDGLRRILNDAVGRVDAILSSGGVSTGDEDHVSALLGDEGQIDTWRIAIKPGRPLALGLWQGVPLIGLPGNPVAALVCTLLFAHPALRRLAGGDWPTPQGFMVPAAFSKRKKPGRAEYLRARMTAEGEVEVFPSEGSGRVSGLSWAEGLVELDASPREIRPGDQVRFLPYASFD